MKLLIKKVFIQKKAVMKKALVSLFLLFLGASSPIQAADIFGEELPLVNTTHSYTITLTYTPLGTNWTVSGGGSTSNPTSNNTTKTYTTDVTWTTSGSHTLHLKDFSGSTIETHSVTVVNPPMVAGTVSGGTTVCLGTTAVLSATDASSGTGSYTYAWKWSDAPTTGYTSAPGTSNALSYTTAAITHTKYLKLEYTDGNETVESDYVTLNTFSGLQVGSIDAQTEIICSGNSPSTINSTSPTTGGKTPYSYLWESSDNGTSGWTPASGTNNGINYTPSVLNATKFFRRKDIENCNSSAYSQVKEIIATTSYTMGSVTGTEMFCYGASLDVDLSYSGSVSHPNTIITWERKLPQGNWLIVGSSPFSGNYIESNVAEGTEYRVTVASACTTDHTASKIMDHQLELMAPVISGNQTICSGTTAIISGSATSGGTGSSNYQYTWLSSSNATSGYISAPGTNNQLSYTTSQITSTKYFKLQVNDGCHTKISSAYIRVDNYSSLQSGSIEANLDMVCSNSAAPTIASTGLAINGSGSYGYLWEWSDNGLDNWTTVPGTNNQVSYSPPVQTSNKHYRRKATDGCSDVAYTSIKEIQAVTPYNIGSISGNTNFCYGANIDIDLTYSGNSSHPNTLIVWEKKLPSGSWTIVGNSPFEVNHIEMDVPSGTQYRVSVGNVCLSDYTAALSLENYPELIPPSMYGNHTICNSSTIGLSGTEASGGKGTSNYQYTWLWSDNVGSGYTLAPGINDQLSYTTPQITSQKYFKLQVDDGCHIKTSSTYIAVDDFATLLAGSIDTAVESICPQTGAETINNNGLPSGGSGAYTYLWEWSSDGSNNWTTAPGTSNQVSYGPPNQTSNKFYRRKVTDSCGEYTYTSSKQVQLTVPYAISNVAGTKTYYNYASGLLTIEGYEGNIMTWEKRVTGTSIWQDLNNTTETQAFSNETQSYEYRVTLGQTPCPTNYSSIVEVKVIAENPRTAGSIEAPHIITIPSAVNSTLQIVADETILSSTLEYYTPNLTSWSTLTCNSCIDVYDIGYANMNIPLQLMDKNSSRTFKATYTTASGTFTTPLQTIKYAALPDDSFIQQQYIKQYGLLSQETDAFGLDALNNTEVVKSITYVDGLGRGIQSVLFDASPTEKDIVSFAKFDEHGRPERNYLPFTASGSEYYSDASTLQSDFYTNTTGIATDANPYAETKYEASPYGRVLEQGAPGTAWQLGSGHTPTFSYRFNTSDEVLNWKADGSCTGYYPSGTMYVNELTDENLNQVITYTDLEGKLIMKKTQAGTDKWPVTQNIYDDYGKLMYVLPPKFNEEISQGTEQLENNYTLVMGDYTVTDQNYSGGSYYYMPGARVFIDPNFLSNDGFEVVVYPGSTIGMDFISDLVFSYAYDDDGRVIEKKVPGAAPTYYVYDMYDQLLLTQDGNTRKSNQWAFVKYDNQGRPVYSGLYTDNTDTTRAAMQVLVDAIDYSGSDLRFEAVSGDVNGYTNAVFPTQNVEVLTINYYDNYDFDRNATILYSYDENHLSGSSTTTETYSRGLATSSKIRILGTNNWLQTVVFYDNQGFVIQTLSNNHMNLALEDKTTTIYDFSGKVDKVKSTQKTGSAQIMNVENTYHYDHTGRVLSIDQKNDDDTSVTLASYSYNELGQLIEKKLHSVDGGTTYLQSVDFAYNIRGWLKNINDPDNLAADQYWGLELSYQEDVNGQHVAFNGNITATKWGDNTSGTTKVKGYSYEYDKMDRLTKATYGEGSSLNTNTDTYTVHSIKYDANGNIENLIRNASHETLGKARIDDLDLTYQGNQLMKTHDNKGEDGFKNGTNSGFDYTYDQMGNLLTDQNKGIDTMFYNVINKVDSIHFSDGRAIGYIYSASGQKLSMKNYLNNALVKTTDYVGNALYEDQALKLFGTSEGRVVVDQSSGAPVNEYEYALSDHTGNTRVVFTASPETSTYKAEFEDASYTQDTTYFYNIGARYNHPDPNNTGKAIRLNNATNANSVGPGISIPVYPGDTLNMSVKAYYADGSGHGTTGLDLAAMTTAVAGAFGGLNGGTEAQQLIHDIFNEGAGAGLLAGGSGNDAIPSAYLNYLIFDKEFKMDTTKSGFVGIQSGEDIEQTLSVTDLVIEEVGYLYLYVSNESNSTNFVYFDDLSVTHKEGRVNQYSEYYPFGLKTEQSWERTWTEPNKYQYNGGSELNITTGNYETFYRPYDPTIGRFTGIDPLASSFTSWTPYMYAFNDPVFYNDPTGAAPEGGDWFETFMPNAIGVGKSGRGNFGGGDTDPCAWGTGPCNGRRGRRRGGRSGKNNSGDGSWSWSAPGANFKAEHANSPAEQWQNFTGGGTNNQRYNSREDWQRAKENEMARYEKNYRDFNEGVERNLEELDAFLDGLIDDPVSTISGPEDYLRKIFLEDGFAESEFEALKGKALDYYENGISYGDAGELFGDGLLAYLTGGAARALKVAKPISKTSKATKGVGNGKWVSTTESMSDAAANYQKIITGKSANQSYLLNGTKFDGLKKGVLIDAKSGYSNFINKSTGGFHSWFKGGEGLVSQAQRQLKAAGGTPIQWHFQNKTVRDATQNLFNSRGINGIELKYTPK